MPLVLGAASATAAAGVVTNSCRYNDGDSPCLSMTPSLGNVDKWTLSMWYKRSFLGGVTYVAASQSGSNDTSIALDTSGRIDWVEYQGSNVGRLLTTQVFLDPAAWYHLVFVWDTGNVTAGNRMRLYVNGTEITVFTTDTQPSSDQDSILGTAVPITIGNLACTSGFCDGYFAEVALCDGETYAASDFGEFDSDSPTIWKPKSLSGLSFGISGFYLDFEDSADLGADVSGLGNDFTVSNLVAADQSQDTPDNNFATMTPLNTSSLMTLSNGNNTCTGNSAANMGNTTATMCPNAGKWYAECEIGNVASATHPKIGAFQINANFFGRMLNSSTGMAGYFADSFSFYSTGTIMINNSETASWGSSVSNGDITAIAIDCDNGAAYLAINNTWQDSGDPTSGASKTGAAVTWTPANSTGVTFADSEFAGVGTSYTEWNFGNGCFGDTLVTSAEADGNGYGLFEYAPPSGYLALCTKNLGSDGG